MKLACEPFGMGVCQGVVTLVMKHLDSESLNSKNTHCLLSFFFFVQRDTDHTFHAKNIAITPFDACPTELKHFNLSSKWPGCMHFLRLPFLRLLVAKQPT